MNGHSSPGAGASPGLAVAPGFVENDDANNGNGCCCLGCGGNLGGGNLDVVDESGCAAIAAFTYVWRDTGLLSGFMRSCCHDSAIEVGQNHLGALYPLAHVL